MASRYLGVDWGTKRIGLALGGPEQGVGSPLKMIHAGPSHDDDARSILAVAHEYDADGIVIGLPLNMDGTEGPQAKRSRELARAIEGLLVSGGDGASGGDRARGIEIHLHDERLTSHAADQRLIERELTRGQKKARQDAVAAQILLQSFLDAQTESE